MNIDTAALFDFLKTVWTSLGETFWAVGPALLAFIWLFVTIYYLRRDYLTSEASLKKEQDAAISAMFGKNFTFSRIMYHSSLGFCAFLLVLSAFVWVMKNIYDNKQTSILGGQFELLGHQAHSYFLISSTDNNVFFSPNVGGSIISNIVPWIYINNQDRNSIQQDMPEQLSFTVRHTRTRERRVSEDSPPVREPSITLYDLVIQFTPDDLPYLLRRDTRYRLVRNQSSTDLSHGDGQTSPPPSFTFLTRHGRERRFDLRNADFQLDALYNFEDIHRFGFDGSFFIRSAMAQQNQVDETQNIDEAIQKYNNQYNESPEERSRIINQISLNRAYINEIVRRLSLPETSPDARIFYIRVLSVLSARERRDNRANGIIQRREWLTDSALFSIIDDSMDVRTELGQRSRWLLRTLHDPRISEQFERYIQVFSKSPRALRSCIAGVAIDVLSHFGDVRRTTVGPSEFISLIRRKEAEIIPFRGHLLFPFHRQELARFHYVIAATSIEYIQNNRNIGSEHMNIILDIIRRNSNSFEEVFESLADLRNTYRWPWHPARIVAWRTNPMERFDDSNLQTRTRDLSCAAE
jgi:hypothetical protein